MLANNWRSFHALLNTILVILKVIRPKVKSTSSPRTQRVVKKTVSKEKSKGKRKRLCVSILKEVTIRFNVNWFNQCQFEISNIIQPYPSCFLLARFYPMTSVPKAVHDDPAGAASVSESFKWPHMFIKKVAAEFGVQFVIERLQSWRWSCSTTFSGVGAPESVRA